MALKIVGRSSRISVSERRDAPSQAKEMAMKCDACGKLAYVTFRAGISAAQRMEGVKIALDEHRKVCTAGGAEIRRTFELWYPRR